MDVEIVGARRVGAVFEAPAARVIARFEGPSSFFAHLPSVDVSRLGWVEFVVWLVECLECVKGSGFVEDLFDCWLWRWVAVAEPPGWMVEYIYALMQPID